MDIHDIAIILCSMVLVYYLLLLFNNLTHRRK